jgi:hypothetical protein
MGSTSSSLVLGLAAGLPAESIEPCLRSLCATGYSGRVGLVLAKNDAATSRRLEGLADFTLTVDDRYRCSLPKSVIAGVRALKNRRASKSFDRAYVRAFMILASAGPEWHARDRWERLEFTFEGLQALRYKYYYEILQTVATDADQVLLTDLRDVLFQRDPFEEPLDSLEVFLEVPNHTLGTEVSNRQWNEALFDPAYLETFGDLTVSCSGTVIGLRADILDYLTAMQSEIIWRRRPLGAADQAIHNYLIRTGRLPGAKVVRNEYGRVLTMFEMPSVQRNAAGELANIDGSVPAVLHQYDRLPALAKALLPRLTVAQPKLAHDPVVG